MQDIGSQFAAAGTQGRAGSSFGLEGDLSAPGGIGSTPGDGDVAGGIADDCAASSVQRREADATGLEGIGDIDGTGDVGGNYVQCVSDDLVGIDFIARRTRFTHIKRGSGAADSPATAFHRQVKEVATLVIISRPICERSSSPHSAGGVRQREGEGKGIRLAGRDVRQVERATAVRSRGGSDDKWAKVHSDSGGVGGAIARVRHRHQVSSLAGAIVNADRRRGIVQQRFPHLQVYTGPGGVDLTDLTRAAPGSDDVVIQARTGDDLSGDGEGARLTYRDGNIISRSDATHVS